MNYQLLIVDDEVPIRKALSNYIHWEDYNCTVYDTASNGKEAIKKLDEHPVDLVITDVKMPLIDGIELSKYIYNNHPNTLIIILSGYAEFEYAQSALHYHVSEYMLKPVSKKKLITAVQNTLKQKKAAVISTETIENSDRISERSTTKYSIFVKQAISFINEHLTENLSLELIAEHVHSNASYLSRIFKKEVGISVVSYITDLRIKKAKDLLEHSNLRTGEISDAVGIHDPAYFSVVFKKYTGMSPKAYRNNFL